MQEVDSILYRLGYLSDDPLKKEEIKGYMAEADEFMTSSGVKQKHIPSPLARTVRSLWSDARDNKQPIELAGKDAMIVCLISKLKRKE